MFLKIQYFFSQFFGLWILFENSKFFENNIIIVEVA